MTFLDEAFSDVVVVGAGLAGLCAACAAAERRVRVLLLEAREAPGGLTAASQGVFNAFDPRRQHALGVSDSPQLHWEETLAFGSAQNQRELSRTLCYDAFSALERLEACGVRFEDDLLPGPGLTTPRGHRPAAGAGGSALVRAMTDEARRSGVDIRCGRRVIRVERGPWSGFRIAARAPGGAETFRCRAVILAGGGFAADRVALERIAPLSRWAYVPPQASDGGLLECALELGAQEVGEGFLSCVLTGSPVNGAEWRPQNALPAVFANPAEFIALDARGGRFFREDVPADRLLLEALAAGGGTFLLIAREPCWSGGERPPWTSFRIDGPEAAEAALGLPRGRLTEAVAAYNDGCRLGRDAFGRSPGLLRPFDMGRLLVCRARVLVAATLGGVLIHTDGAVAARRGGIVPGLYAAGDMTGGVHGRSALPGNLLTSAAVFGFRAGRAAATWTQNNQRV